MGTRFGIPGTEVELDPAAEPASGLSKLCYASCTNLSHAIKALMGPVVGVLSDAVMRRIEDALKQVLAIR